MKRLSILCTALLICAPAFAAPKPAPKSPPLPQPERVVLPMDRPMGIAAVVNEDVITTQDVEDRALLIMALTGAGTSEQSRAQLITRTLSMLIDETLQMQEAKRNSIDVSPKEVDEALATMEKSRGRPPGSLAAFVHASNLSESSLRRQFEAQIAWHKTTIKKLRRQLTVTDAEVMRAQQTAMNPQKRHQVQLMAIAVPVVDSAQEKQAADLAKDLATQLSNGKTFEDLGRSMIGRKDVRVIPALWLDEEQLEPPVAQALRTLAPGDTTQPLRSLQTYQIIKLLARRDTLPVNPKTEVALKQVQLALAPTAPPKEVDAMMTIAKSFQANPGTCGEPGIAGVTDFSGMNIKVNYLRTTFGAMSREMAAIVTPMEVGEAADPYLTKDGLEMLMLCEKIEAPLGAPNKEEVKARILNERAELESEKMLRNLKRDAFIDIRGGTKK